MTILSEFWVWCRPGWYACRQERTHRNDHIVWYYVGNNPDVVPETYYMGLGTPEWFDGVPDPGEIL